MRINSKLSAKDAEFFQAVSAAAFSNPFSPERDQFDRVIGGTAGPSRESSLEAAVKAVRLRTTALHSQGALSLKLYDQNDQELLANGILFDFFHTYLKDFDALIKEQLLAGDDPCPVVFSGELLALFRERGFSADAARQYFALFYQLRRAFYFINQLSGDSPSMQELRCKLWNNIFTCNPLRFKNKLWDKMEDFSTLLLGETGTGKGAAAAAIGRSGHIPFNEKTGRFAESFTRNFISINLSQFSEALIESELFGHKKGAFSGAIENHEGVFSRCVPHGTIFLDEIGEVSVPIQIKLLKVLQERTFSPVGSHATKRFRGRIVAATNRPLKELRAEGTFRDDFYYRLCSDVIEVPSLKQQLEEKPSSLNALIKRVVSNIMGEEDKSIVDTVKEELPQKYHWPGNIRELEQAIRRILLSGHYRGESLALPTKDQDNLQSLAEAEVPAAQMLSAYCKQLYAKLGTYEEVARRAEMDRRTVKKYIDEA